MPLISIITACYNHGIYLDDVISSINYDKYRDYFEHIIVNDGSTDKFTLDKLTEVERKGWVVIHQENKGLATARNKGIKEAKGKYILPLDCDNKIVPEIFIRASHIMEKDETIDVVYTDAMYFGEKNEKWKVGKFSLNRMLYGNYIDACALIRKETFFKYGCYDMEMPVMGHEDWELWIKIALAGGKFYYLKKIGFYYRVLTSSMSNTISTPNYLKSREYLYKKYSDSIALYMRSLDKENFFMRQFRRMANKVNSFNK